MTRLGGFPMFNLIITTVAIRAQAFVLSRGRHREEAMYCVRLGTIASWSTSDDCGGHAGDEDEMGDTHQK